MRLLCLVAAILTIFSVLTSAGPVTGLLGRHEEIDLETGRARYTRVVCGVPVKREIRHTPISEALGIGDIASKDGQWVRVNTFTAGSHISPHYIYHSALSQTEQLRIIWQCFHYSPEAQREVAQNVLSLWRESHGDHGAKNYIAALHSLTQEEVSLQDVIPLRSFKAREE